MRRGLYVVPLALYLGFAQLSRPFFDSMNEKE